MPPSGESPQPAAAPLSSRLRLWFRNPEPRACLPAGGRQQAGGKVTRAIARSLTYFMHPGTVAFTFAPSGLV